MHVRTGAVTGCFFFCTTNRRCYSPDGSPSLACPLNGLASHPGRQMGPICSPLGQQCSPARRKPARVGQPPSTELFFYSRGGHRAEFQLAHQVGPARLRSSAPSAPGEAILWPADNAESTAPASDAAFNSEKNRHVTGEPMPLVLRRRI